MFHNQIDLNFVHMYCVDINCLKTINCASILITSQYVEIGLNLL